MKLTNSLVLPAGTYVVVANLPNTSTWMAVQLYGVADHYGHGQMLQDSTWIITLTQETEIYLRTASSTSCTYSYTERGRLTAVKISGSEDSLTPSTSHGEIPITNSPLNGYSDSTLKWQRYGNVVTGYFAVKTTASISA